MTDEERKKAYAWENVKDIVRLSFWGTLGLLIVGLIGFLIWCAFWVTNIDQHELGFTFDRNAKEGTEAVQIVPYKGWVVRTPFKYSVHTIDLRPYQITISANERVLNAKLVQFNPDGLQTFVKWHGRRAGDMHSQFLEILKCYAFDKAEGKDCPFITILQDIAPNQSAIPAEVKK